MQTYGYTRVSTQGQADNGHSLDAQVSAIQKYCADRELPTPIIFTEAAVSAAKFKLRERTYGNDLFNAVRPDDVVIVTKLDRAFRNTADAVVTVDAWSRRGVNLVVLDFLGGSLDTRDPVGKFTLTLFAALAELERSTTSQRTKAVAADRWAKGYSVGRVPYGYVQVPYMEGRNRVFRVEEVPEQQKVIKRIKALYAGGRLAGGMSAEEIARTLNAEGVPTQHGKLWCKQTIIRVIKRKVP